MQLLFSISDTITSRAIRQLTGEPVSHVALRIGYIVLHQTLTGVKVTTYGAYKKENTVLGVLTLKSNVIQMYPALTQKKTSLMGYLRLCYIVILYTLGFSSSSNLRRSLDIWDISGLHICTEWLGEKSRYNRHITPYTFYRILIEETDPS